jgi:hypothetical protein
MPRRAVTLAALALCSSVVLAQGAGAAGTSVTVPKAANKTATMHWSGTYTTGTNLGTFFTAVPDCKDATGQMVTSHAFNVAVPRGAYNLVKAKMFVDVESSPFLNGDFMEVLDPAGNSQGVDYQKEQMEVEVINPKAGKWTVLTCEFVPDTPGDHPYTGTVTIKTSKKR